jgi:NitT/TauT family transport system permease protein
MSELTLSQAPAEPRLRGPAPRRLGRGVPGRLALNAASLGACLAAWALVCHFKLDLGAVTFRNLPSPLEVARGAVAFARSGAAAHHIWASVRRVLIGFALAGVFGVALGLIAGRLRLARELAMPPLEVLRPIPAVAWIPLAILMFRSAEGSMIFITFVGAVFPILLNTIHGVEGVDRRLVASARSLGARPAAVFREVIFPAALPSIVTGLVIGMGTSWFCLITAEMISGQFGVGYCTWMSYTVQDYPGVVLGMILIGLLGLGSSVMIRRVGDLFLRWRAAGAQR